MDGLGKLFYQSGIDLCVNPESDTPERLIKQLKTTATEPRVLAELQREQYRLSTFVEDIHNYRGLPAKEQNRLRNACMNIGERLGGSNGHQHRQT